MKTRETKFGTYIEMETETSTKLTEIVHKYLRN